MRKRFLTIQLLFFLAVVSASGQNWTTDSLNLGNKLFTIELTSNFKRTADNYTEGIILNYLFSDTSMVTIFYGANATLTPYKHEEFDTLTVNSNTYSGTVGRTGKLWKAVKVSDRFMYWYNLVDSDQQATFDRTLNSIKLETKRRGG